jgi:hypothetical protein
VSFCMESCLVGRLNRLIREVPAPRLQHLTVYMCPDDLELSRMSVLELHPLPLLHLHISNSYASRTPFMQGNAVGSPDYTTGYAGLFT